MKGVDRLYDRLTPVERFQIAVAAFGRGDLNEVDRLNDAAPWREFRIQEPAYFDRLQRITWAALYFAVEARDQQIAILAAFTGFALRLTTSDAAHAETAQDDTYDEELVNMLEVMAERISRLKALHAAWTKFCTDLGVSTTDVDNMLGEPVMGRMGKLEMIEEVFGEVDPDEDHEREYLAVMTRFWNTKIRELYPT